LRNTGATLGSDVKFETADRRFVTKICISEKPIIDIDFRESIIANADLCYKLAIGGFKFES